MALSAPAPPYRDRALQRVLLIEADRSLSTVVRRHLTRLGYDVLLTVTATEAVRHLAEQPVALVVAELDILGNAAAQLIGALSKRARPIPCIALAGRATNEHCVAALEAGAAEVIRKPFGPTTLAEAVARALLDSAPEDANQGGRTAAGPGQNDAEAPQEVDAMLRALRLRLQVGAVRLPVAPPVVREIRRVAEDPSQRIIDVLPFVERDQELAARVLRLANSAALGARVRIRNLGDALVRVGARAVVALAVTTVTDRMYRSLRDARLHGLAGQLWRRVVASASATRMISAAAQRPDPDEDYLGCLLAEIGEPLVLRLVDDRLARNGVVGDEAAFTKAVKDHHPAFGAALLEAWDLGDVYARLATHHHAERRPALADTPEDLIRFAILEAGRRAAWALDHTPDENAPEPGSREDCLAAVGIDEGAWLQVVDDLPEALADEGLS